MIKITITKDKECKYKAFDAEGHAKNSVCIAMSSVSQAIINSIIENTESMPVLIESYGETKIRLSKEDANKYKVQLLMKTLADFCLGMKAIYSNQIVIIHRTEGECNEY